MQQTVFNFHHKSKNFNLFKQTLGETICGEISHCVRIWEKKWGNLLVRTYLGRVGGGEPGLSFFVRSGLTTFLRCKQKILQCYNNLSNIHLQQALFFHVHMFIIFLSFNSKDVLLLVFFSFFFQFWKSGRLVPSRFDEQFYNNLTRTIFAKRKCSDLLRFSLKFLQCNCTNFFKLFFVCFFFFCYERTN